VGRRVVVAGDSDKEWLVEDSSTFQAFDWQRIFIGDLPWIFTLEIIVRTLIIYVYTLLLVRLLSRRAVAQLSLIEFLLVIALGSAVGDPMFYPDVPLLHGMAVIAVVVLLNYGLSWLVMRHEAIEHFVEGQPVLLVEEGYICVENLVHGTIGREELFEYLRLHGVEYLGVLRQVYMEQGGQLSVFCYAPRQERPGLRINPPWELAPPQCFVAGDPAPASTWMGCMRCGWVQQFEQESLPTCPRCGFDKWTDNVSLPKEPDSS
jgi:uncharacterized membrane protein YcaP (DUF421 family)